ncbi:MAG: hypothetical protein AB7O26_12775 [Planctomycetaceae bacterium]
MLSFSVALGAAGIYLILVQPIEKKSNWSRQLPGIAVASLGLILLAWHVARLPLHDPSASETPASVPILVVLGAGAAFAAGMIVTGRTPRIANLGFCILAACVAGTLAVQSAWLAAAATIAVGMATVFVGLLLRQRDRSPAGSLQNHAESIEPFLGSVAGGMLALTILTTLCGVAVASVRLSSSDVGKGALVQTNWELQTSSMTSVPAERMRLSEGTVALAILSITTAARWLAGGQPEQELISSDSSG